MKKINGIGIDSSNDSSKTGLIKIVVEKKMFLIKLKAYFNYLDFIRQSQDYYIDCSSSFRM